MLFKLYEQILTSLLWNFLNIGEPEIANAYLQKLQQLQQLQQKSQNANFSTRIQQKILETKLFLDNYRHGTTPQQMGDNAKNYAKFLVENLHLSPQFDFSKYKNPKNSKRLHLKLGFVSGDFKAHPSSYFLLGLLNALQNLQTSQDKKIKKFKKITFDFYFYNNCKQTDEITLKIKALARAWTDIYNLDDLQTANKIYADKIQILFDLSGHTALNRLPMFALKPAPIQISWIGWLGSSGVASMDYFAGDNFLIPKNSENLEQQFCEKFLRFQNIWLVYTPPENIPKVKETPLLKNNFITFGCVQNINKVNENVIKTWAKILNSLPNSQFCWVRFQFIDETLKQRVFQKFAKYNVDISKINLICNHDHAEYLAAYEKFDFILDTFPVSGGTTTCEALWQGVPILTLCGNLMASRLSASCLQNVGLNDWVCHNENEYVEKAVNLANTFLQNPQQLNDLRLHLREQMKNSPLCDANLFAQNFQNTMQNIWNDFVNS